MEREPPCVLSIAGSDSSGGAGLQMDLKVFAALGVWGTTAATALTAQDTRGVQRVYAVPPRFVAAQIDAVARDLPVAAVKTGMLGRTPVVLAVAQRLRRRRLSNLVVDPVLCAKNGRALLTAGGLAALKRSLLPAARVVTPNLPEAESLTGAPIRDNASLRDAACSIARLGPGLAVVIKGGHRPDAPVDLLFDGEQFHEIEGERLAGAPVHGTGCIYSAALAARLAWGDGLPEACRAAKRFVEAAIRGAWSAGGGARLAWIGPAEGA
jgi:hydroxymethylpyrimidine kinase/phosphomethylpyrimidine kinase